MNEDETKEKKNDERHLANKENLTYEEKEKKILHNEQRKDNRKTKGI